MVLTTGNAGDSPALPVLLSQLRIPRPGCGRPRTTPDALLADKAYSAKAHRDALRARGVKVVIPEKTDQQTNRKNRGSKGGRPVDFDAEAYKGRNVVERAFNNLAQYFRSAPDGPITYLKSNWTLRIGTFGIYDILSSTTPYGSRPGWVMCSIW